MPISVSNWPSSRTPCPPKPAILMANSLEMVSGAWAVLGYGASSSLALLISSTSGTERCGTTAFCDGSCFRSRKTFSGKAGIIFSATHWRASTGSLPQMVGQGERISTKEKPTPSRWILERAAHGFAGLHDVLVVGERDALHVDGRFEGRDQFGHVQREAFIARDGGPRATSCSSGRRSVVGAIWPPVMP